MSRVAVTKPCRARDLVREAIYTAAFNTAIGLFLWSLGFSPDLGKCVLFSQCIGLSIFASVRGALSFSGRGPHPLLLVATGLAVGSVAGTFLGALVTGEKVLAPGQYRHFLTLVSFGVIFGTIISHFFLSRAKVVQTQAALNGERIQSLANEKRVIEARLKLLQAQVEPHFLFNTLSTVLGLMDNDPARSREMLESLTRYLRASLARTREDATTLGEELEMVNAYLAILGIRMGARLRYAVDVPPQLSAVPFPPMLLQPLVENAIRHGVEPEVEGGEVRVHGASRDGRLRLTVEDTGRGFQGERAAGTGLQNVRERLRFLYGENGQLLLEENEPSGVRVVLEVPRE
jgi:hypothetical protein